MGKLEKTIRDLNPEVSGQELGKDCVTVLLMINVHIPVLDYNQRLYKNNCKL